MVRVSVGALDDTSLIAAFVPAIVTAPPGPRIAITVHFASFTRPATYAVELAFIGKPPAAGERPRQKIVLQLTHPGATLRPAGTWIVAHDLDHRRRRGRARDDLGPGIPGCGRGEDEILVLRSSSTTRRPRCAAIDSLTRVVAGHDVQRGLGLQTT